MLWYLEGRNGKVRLMSLKVHNDILDTLRGYCDGSSGVVCIAGEKINNVYLTTDVFEFSSDHSEFYITVDELIGTFWSNGAYRVMSHRGLVEIKFFNNSTEDVLDEITFLAKPDKF